MLRGVLITFTAHNRVQYMRDVLESWSRAYGISDCDLVFWCEPGCPDMVDLIKARAPGRSVRVEVNRRVMGALRNPHQALSDGFDRDDFVLLAEDDSIVSRDVLEYVQWARDMYRHDLNVLAVCTFHDCAEPDDGVVLSESFSPTVWGTWLSRWPELDETWDHDYSTGVNGRQAGWDWNINLRVRGGRRFVMPTRSRSQHIGRHGTHMTEQDFERLQSHCFQPEHQERP
jgi:hypothetical protein